MKVSVAFTVFGLVGGMAQAFAGVEQQGPAQAQDQQQQQQQQARAVSPLQAYKFFEGTWNCSSDAVAQDGTPLHTGQVTMTSALNDKWYQFSWSSASTGGIGGVTYEGYDPVLKKFVRLGLVNNGGYSGGVSDGWQNGTIVWEGQGTDTKERGYYRHTITRLDDNTYHMAFEGARPGHPYVTLGTGTCKK